MCHAEYDNIFFYCCRSLFYYYLYIYGVGSYVLFCFFFLIGAPFPNVPGRCDYTFSYIYSNNNIISRLFFVFPFDFRHRLTELLFYVCACVCMCACARNSCIDFGLSTYPLEYFFHYYIISIRGRKRGAREMRFYIIIMAEMFCSSAGVISRARSNFNYVFCILY